MNGRAPALTCEVTCVAKLCHFTPTKRWTTSESVSCYEDVDGDDVGVDWVQQIGHCVIDVAHLTHM